MKKISSYESYMFLVAKEGLVALVVLVGILSNDDFGMARGTAPYFRRYGRELVSN